MRGRGDVIEQGIYFALGCFLTALVALLFAPVFWRRALRLTRQRLQLQIPLSMQEILAERDELRAEFAVDRVRLEQVLAEAQAKADALMAECGRQTMATDALESERATQATELAEQRTRIATLEQEAVAALEARVQSEQAAQELAEDRDGWRERTSAGLAQQERLKREIESQRTTIAGLETAKAGLELRLEDGARAMAHEQEAVRTLKSRLETAMMQATRHEGAGILLRRELDDAQSSRRQLEEELGAARAALRDAKREHDREVASLREVQADRDKINGLLRRERDEVRVQLAKTENELSSVRSDIAARDNRIKDLEAQLGLEAEHKSVAAALRRELQEAYGRVRHLEAQVTEVGSLRTERGKLREELERLTIDAEKLRGELEAAKPQDTGAAEVEAREHALRAELTTAQARAESLERKLRSVETTLNENRERDRAANLARGLLAEKARRTERLLEAQIKTLNGETAQLREALQAAGAAADPATSAAESPKDADLRQTIHALGVAVADITRQMGAADAPAGGPNRRRKQGEPTRSVGAI